MSELELDSTQRKEPPTDPALALLDTMQASGPMSLHPGARIGHHEIIRPLGRGGMARVFLARDTKLGRLVAIKLLTIRDPDTADRLLAEARATASCHHENIVIVHEVSESAQQPYMVLEYLRGQTMREHMGATPLPGARVLELLIPVVRALVHAHGAGLIHRDLKPENIMVTESGVIKVLDFGIAKQRRPQASARDIRASVAEQAPTSSSGAMGTLPYMSPEQWAAGTVDQRSDLWALGIMAYEMLAGRHPLAPLSVAGLRVVADRSVPMPSALETLPEAGELASVIDACLVKEPEQRLASARELLASLERIATTSKQAPLSDTCPYAGLTPFQEADAAHFYGREQDIGSALARLRTQVMLAVTAPTGAGKSSFIQAGLVPALRRSGTRWRVLSIRPGRNPIAAMAAILAQESQDYQLSDSLRDRSMDDRRAELSARLRALPGFLAHELREYARARGCRILLFVDQFEELYTLEHSPNERAAFCACLDAVADDPSSPLRVVLTVRSDFLDRAAEDRDFIARLTRGLMFLPPLGRAGLRSALVEPLAAIDYEFEEPALIEQMLDELENTRGALPLLQFTAAKLWAGRDRSRRVLTRAFYQRLGGLAGTLASHADAVLASLSRAERSLARALFLRLVTAERTRALTGLSELRARLDGDASAGALSGVFTRVFDRLVAARLLMVHNSDDTDGAAVEIVHDSLIERWPALRRWLDENHDNTIFSARLASASKEWHRGGRAAGMLWRDEAVAEARRFARRYDGEQAPIERDYLAAVFAFADRHARRRRRTLIAFGVLLLAVAVVTATLAWRERRANQRMRAAYGQAQYEATRARDAARMAAARDNDGDPTTQLALLRDVERPELISQWHTGVLEALGRPIAENVLSRHRGYLYSAHLSSNGRWATTAADDGQAYLWDVRAEVATPLDRGGRAAVHETWFSGDGRRLVATTKAGEVLTWPLPELGVAHLVNAEIAASTSVAQVSPSGRVALAGTHTGSLYVFDLQRGGAPVVVPAHRSTVIGIVVSADDSTIVSMDKTGDVRVWSATGRLRANMQVTPGLHVDKLSVGPRGQKLAVVPSERELHLWSVAGGLHRSAVIDLPQPAADVKFSPDGARVASILLDSTVRVWKVESPGQGIALRGHQGQILVTQFSPDSTQLLTVSQDSTARLWDLDSNFAPTILRGHRGWLSSGAFSRDGTRVITASGDGDARVWSVATRDLPSVIDVQERGFVITARPSRDGRRLLTAGQDVVARIWSMDEHRPPIEMRGHTQWLRGARFSPDERQVLTFAEDASVRLWDSSDGTEQRVLRGHATKILNAIYRHDGQQIASYSDDGAVFLWDPRTGRGERITEMAHRRSPLIYSRSGSHLYLVLKDGAIRKVALSDSASDIELGRSGEPFRTDVSPDERWLVTTGGDSSARVFAADGSGEAMHLHGHEDEIQYLAFSPDGRYLATCSLDRTVRIWDLNSGRARSVWPAKLGLRALGYSADGRLLAAYGEDGNLRVWRTDGDGEPILLLGGNTQSMQPTFFADGTRVLATSSEGKVRIWAIPEQPLSLERRVWTTARHCLAPRVQQHLLAMDAERARATEAHCRERVRTAGERSAESPRIP